MELKGCSKMLLGLLLGYHHEYYWYNLSLNYRLKITDYQNLKKNLAFERR